MSSVTNPEPKFAEICVLSIMFFSACFKRSSSFCNRYKPNEPWQGKPCFSTHFPTHAQLSSPFFYFLFHGLEGRQVGDKEGPRELQEWGKSISAHSPHSLCCLDSLYSVLAPCQYRLSHTFGHRHLCQPLFVCTRHKRNKAARLFRYNLLNPENYF